MIIERDTSVPMPHSIGPLLEPLQDTDSAWSILPMRCRHVLNCEGRACALQFLSIKPIEQLNGAETVALSQGTKSCYLHLRSVAECRSCALSKKRCVRCTAVT